MANRTTQHLGIWWRTSGRQYSESIQLLGRAGRCPGSPALDPHEADETHEYPQLTDDEDPHDGWDTGTKNDNIEHVNGAGIDNPHVEVLDEDGNTVRETDDVDIVDAIKTWWTKTVPEL